VRIHRGTSKFNWSRQVIVSWASPDIIQEGDRVPDLKFDTLI